MLRRSCTCMRNDDCAQLLPLQASNITAFQQQEIFGPSGPLALAVQAVVCDVLHLGLNGTFLGNSSGPACSTNMSHGLSTMTKGPGMPRPEIP